MSASPPLTCDPTVLEPEFGSLPLPLLDVVAVVVVVRPVPLQC